MKKILIIEDEMAIAELEKDYLELSGFQVTIETDGAKGEKKAMSGKYDLLILDVMLPGRDGFEICSRFRQQFQEPVIIVSAKDEDIDKIHGLVGLEADDYMTKSLFNPTELVARVKAHLNRYETLTNHSPARENGNEVIEAGELRMDKTARRVFVRGEEKNFTVKEFDLLYFLAENPDCVYSKDELFQKLWDSNAVGDSATVTVHIKKIREKIGDNSSDHKYITTVSRRGYRFNAQN